ncbi:MAG: DUF3450 family protein [Planctomycetes bacterium]|nr:DUF3450 family protein [Planctomycetota bacterium]MBI3847893.1 DUF3450 family protein [Planctomycetota bacterium]
MTRRIGQRPAVAGRAWSACGPLSWALAAMLGPIGPGATAQSSGSEESAPAPPTLEETRVKMGKWIETQQIISKERKDWQQGREILTARVDLIKQEAAGLEEKIKRAEAGAGEANKKREELLAEKQKLDAVGTQLTEIVTEMEGEIRRLFKMIPEPIQTKLQPLYQRIPEDPSKTRVSVAERFQNVLGILNELNKTNNEITVNYEVRNLADGMPAEVKAIYVGLTQAYYVSARGEAGIGRPTADGWRWVSSNAVASEVMTALEILDGKHSPAFVPLPVKLQ